MTLLGKVLNLCSALLKPWEQDEKSNSKVSEYWEKALPHCEESS